MLDEYQERFDIVEVNSTFYGVPSSSTVRSWRSHSAKGFEMVWKVVKTVTHEGRMDAESARAELKRFLARAVELGPTLGALLFQCPRGLRVDAEQMRAVAEVIDASGLRCRVAVECRHPDCFDDADLLSFLRARGWALVLHPNSVGRATVGNQSGGRTGESVSHGLEPLRNDFCTAEFVYIRLHGDNDDHTYRYSDAELEQYASQVHDWRNEGKDVLCFFLNDDPKAAMPQNAVRFRELVHAKASEVVPRPPKQAGGRTITSFFAKRPKEAAVVRENSSNPGADGGHASDVEQKAKRAKLASNTSILVE